MERKQRARTRTDPAVLVSALFFQQSKPNQCLWNWVLVTIKACCAHSTNNTSSSCSSSFSLLSFASFLPSSLKAAVLIILTAALTSATGRPWRFARKRATTAMVRSMRSSSRSSIAPPARTLIPRRCARTGRIPKAAKLSVTTRKAVFLSVAGRPVEIVRMLKRRQNQANDHRQGLDIAVRKCDSVFQMPV